MTYWIKQLGLPQHKISETDQCYFTRTIDFPEKPTGIKIGDQLFIFAVGHKYLYAQLEVLSIPFMGHDDEFASNARNRDFPWLLFCRNLNKPFSDRWFEYKLDMLDMAQKYNEETEGLITIPGAPNLNGLLYGNSYIGLRDGFAHYLLQKMTSK